MVSADYELAIIGGGPAGLTAGLYAARAKMGAVLIEKIGLGGQVLNTDWVENYPGFPEGISGPDLVEKMTDQARRFDLEIQYDEVIAIEPHGPVKRIQLSDRTISAHAIILATGASPKKLGVPGEDIFFGKGVSSCATCDGPFYKDGVLAAVGGGDTAVQESLFLTKFAKKIYLIHRRDQLRAGGVLRERALASDKIEVLWDSVLTRIDGLTNVDRVTVTNLKTDTAQELSVDGCFIWVGIQPNTAFLADLLEADESGFVHTDRNMATSLPGIYAAGDARSTDLRQIATAVGDAALAAYSAEHYIETIKHGA